MRLCKNEGSVGVLLALAGALLFSTKAVFVKLAYQYEVDTISLLLLRMGIALPFYLFMILNVHKHQRGGWPKIPIRYWIGLVGAALLGYYLSSFLDFWGLNYIDASIERLILFMYPTFIAIIAFFWFRERITPTMGLALIISYMGLFFVFGQQIEYFSINQDFWKGALLIFLCAITFAFYLVFSQWIIPQFGAVSFTSLCMTLACIMVILHYLMVRPSISVFDLAQPVYYYALAMALFATVLPSYLVSMAIERIGATKAGIISSIGPISTISLAYLFLDERLTIIQGLGGLCIIAGVTFVSIEQRKKKMLQTSKS